MIILSVLGIGILIYEVHLPELKSFNQKKSILLF